jgi:hypothetical protein
MSLSNVDSDETQAHLDRLIRRCVVVRANQHELIETLRGEVT